MNIIIYRISSYHMQYLNNIKNKFINVLSNNLQYKSYNLLYYMKWQINNRLRIQQIKQIEKKIFTVLRSPFVNKKSREQFAILYFIFFLEINSIFNIKYLFSINNFSLKLNFIEKQFYFKEKKKNCYFFKK